MGKKKIKEQSAVPAEEGVKAPAVTTSSKSKKVDLWRVYINASYNNTVLTVTDVKGNVLAWASAGSLGFSGPKKATPFASSKVVAAITEKLKSSAPQSIEILVRGIGGGRDGAIRSLINHGFEVSSIKDVTPIPHNGPRQPKVRRV